MSEFCPTCETYQKTKTVERDETYEIRGQKVTVSVKTHICSACDGEVGSDGVDEAVLDAVHAQYRRQADLLTPEAIKAIREHYRLSQKSFATLLGMSEATVNRYEKGQLQDQLHDTAIRACGNPEFVRRMLARRGNLLSAWQRKRAEQVLVGASESESVFLQSVW